MVKDTKKTGFILVEIIISITLIVSVFVILLGIAFSALNLSASIKKETQANSFIKEEFEALRNFRDGTQWAIDGLGIVNTGNNNPYHLINNSNKWVLVSGVKTEDIFTRQIIFDKVSREVSTQNIEAVYNSSRNDPDTVKVTIKISWQNKTIQNVLYLTNWKK